MKYYGVRINGDEIDVKESDDLNELADYKIKESYNAAYVEGKNMRYVILRKQWNDLKEFDSERAYFLEKMLFETGDEDFYPGKYLKKRAAR